MRAALTAAALADLDELADVLVREVREDGETGGAEEHFHGALCRAAESVIRSNATLFRSNKTLFQGKPTFFRTQQTLLCSKTTLFRTKQTLLCSKTTLFRTKLTLFRTKTTLLRVRTSKVHPIILRLRACRGRNRRTASTGYCNYENCKIYFGRMS